MRISAIRRIELARNFLLWGVTPPKSWWRVDRRGAVVADGTDAMSDKATAIASIPLDELLAALLANTPA